MSRPDPSYAIRTGLRPGDIGAIVAMPTPRGLAVTALSRRPPSDRDPMKGPTTSRSPVGSRPSRAMSV